MIILSAYLVAAVALAFLIYKSTMWFEAKLVLVALFILSSIVVYLQIDNYRDQPIVLDSLPPDVIIYGQCVEAEKVYILGRITGSTEPPSKWLTPLSEDLRKGLSEGMKASKGKPFRMVKNDGNKGKGKGKKKGEKGKGKGSISQESKTWDIKPLPEFKPPEK